MTDDSVIRVMVVDDHAVVRGGLSAFLMACDGLELVGEASGGAEAVELCATVQPDVVLMDLVMPEMDGAVATREIRTRYPHIQVIVLTSFKEQNLIEDALQAGAIGYLLKNVTVDELASAIRSAKLGRPTLAPEATQVLISAAKNPGEQDYDLTPREKEVLSLMAAGFSNPVIAAKMVVSRSTVKFHVSSILSKLGVSSRTEAVALALQHKLIE
ncbi:MAG: response regulator transcription factor [Clostridiales bacterium]|nr:response regulator transcription factor [Eubacteriales bacterium]MDH7566712.1 response regulator transcription factor [Clostridiales bacterium]